MAVALSQEVRRALSEAGVLLIRAQIALDEATKQAGVTWTAGLCADLSEAVEEIQTQVDALLRQPDGPGRTDTDGEGEG